jgi:penicillin-binding protein 1A
MKKKSTKLIKFWIFLFTIILMFVSTVTGFALYFSFDLPDVKILTKYGPPLPSQIMSKNGTVLLSMGKENRDLVKFEDLPKLVIDAVLSAEDSNFFDHKGVDYLGILRAIFVDIKALKFVQGGSTITQQVAKGLLLTKEKSFIRKIKDVMLAQKIEKVFTKQEILEIYLNHVYLGSGFYGIRAALKGYFDKELHKANSAEIALVAGLLVAPGKYSPLVNPQLAKMRQKYVLKRMLENGKINSKDYSESLKLPLKLIVERQNSLIGGHFTDWVKQKVIQQVGPENFLTGGFKITTSLNEKLQLVAEKAVLEGVKKIDKRQGYKGPIKQLTSDEDILKFLQSERERIFKETSNFFHINHDGSITYEFEYDKNNFYEKSKKIIESNFYNNYFKMFEVSKNKLKDKNKNKFKILEMDILSKAIKNDLLWEILSRNHQFNYNAVIIGVDDKENEIYINLGGILGKISKDNFSWAHERKIFEKRLPVESPVVPSLTFKRGDVILVGINKLSDGKISFYLDQEPDVQGALVAMEIKSGEIISLVGGSNFFKSQFNRALQSKRQPGSSVKPLIFALGLEEGFTPSDIIIDSPEALGGFDETMSWKPQNIDRKFLGPITFRKALEDSRNIPTIKLAADIGINKIVQFFRRIGIRAKLEKDLTLALGTMGVTLMEIVNTYSIFPNGGKYVMTKPILSISDREGRVYSIEKENLSLNSLEKRFVLQDENNPEKGTRDLENPYLANLADDYIYDSRLSYIMSNLLRGVVQSGTAQAIKHLGFNIAGKTGTTDDYVDAWFVGFTPDIVVGVWTGFDDNKTMGYGESGSKAAIPIWNEYVKEALKSYRSADFQIPQGIENVLIDKDSGLVTSPDNTNAFLEAFVEGTSPVEESSTEKYNGQIPSTSLDSDQSGVMKTPIPNSILENDEYFKNQ